MKFDTEQIIDTNGQKYRVGRDEYGWLSIESGEMFEGEFYPDDNPIVSFDPSGAETLIGVAKEVIDDA